MAEDPPTISKDRKKDIAKHIFTVFSDLGRDYSSQELKVILDLMPDLVEILRHTKKVKEKMESPIDDEKAQLVKADNPLIQTKTFSFSPDPSTLLPKQIQVNESAIEKNIDAKVATPPPTEATETKPKQSIITLSDLQFGSTTPIFEKTPFHLFSPEIAAAKQEYHTIVFLKSVKISVWTPKNRKNPELRCNFEAFLLSERKEEFVMWHDSIAKLLGLTESELNRYVSKRDLLETKLLHLYLGRPMFIVCKPKIYQNQQSYNIYKICALDWAFMDQEMAELTSPNNKSNNESSKHNTQIQMPEIGISENNIQSDWHFYGQNQVNLLLKKFVVYK